VQHAILHGDDVTGASTFELVAAMDAGPVYGVLTEPILPTDTTGTLLKRLAVAGATLLTATLDGIEDGTLTAIPQPEDGISFTTKITVADAEVDWKLSAMAIDRLIRACTPDPGAWTTLDGARIKLGPLAPPLLVSGTLAPGEVAVAKSDVFVGTGTQAVRLGTVQAPGKRAMSAADWARGLRISDENPVRFG
jgi:methionyl-tRNA formyltransferase